MRERERTDAAAREQREKEQSEQMQPPVNRERTERKEGGIYFPMDLCVNTENCKGLTVK
jgi:hypothetical protein